jgi:hypothetical protein
MAERYRNIPDVARYAYREPDGTIHFFESDGVNGKQGMLPANQGYEPADLEAQGFTFLDAEAYRRTQRSLDSRARAEDLGADELAVAFDARFGAGVPTGGGATNGDQMNGQQGMDLDPATMAILQKYMDEGRLEELFQPFEQEQGVLDQQMAMGQQLRQPGAMRGTPVGSALSSLSNAIGGLGGAYQQNKALEGQRALGERMQGDASGRTAALMELLRQRQSLKGAKAKATGGVEVPPFLGVEVS